MILLLIVANQSTDRMTVVDGDQGRIASEYFHPMQIILDAIQCFYGDFPWDHLL